MYTFPAALALCTCVSVLAMAAGETSCPNHCACTPHGTTALFLECATFPEALPENTEELKLTGIETKQLPVDKLVNRYDLQALDFSALDIDGFSGTGQGTQLPNLEGLILNNNKFTRLNANDFDWCRAVLYLDLSHNDIRDVHQDAFANLRHLKQLILANNKLGETDSRMQLPVSLLTLDLSNNDLQTSRIIDSPLPQLQELNLCGNRYEAYSIPPGLIPEVQRLCLGDVFRFAEPNTLAHFRSLVELNITGDDYTLEDSTLDQISGLRALTSLQLNRFEIVSLTQHLTAGLKSLNELRLYNIKSSEGIQLHALQPLLNLRSLDIKGSPALVNNLAQPLQVAQLNNLQFLGLSNVSLCTVNMAMFSSLPKLNSVDLSINPLVCDSTMQGLIQNLLEGNLRLTDSENTRCAFPKNLAGHLLLDLKTVNDLSTQEAYFNVTVNTTSGLAVNSGIYYHLNLLGIGTDDLLYIILALIIVVFILIMVLLVVGYMKCKRAGKCHSCGAGGPGGSAESFVMTADNEYTFDNFTLSETLAECHRPANAVADKNRKVSSKSKKACNFSANGQNPNALL